MSKFAKRHYEAIAEVMRETCPFPQASAHRKTHWTYTVARLAAMFKADNSKFDERRFEDACKKFAIVIAVACLLSGCASSRPFCWGYHATAYSYGVECGVKLPT